MSIISSRVNDSDEDDELSYEEKDLLRKAFERDLKRNPSWSDVKNGLKTIESDYNALKARVEAKIQRKNSFASMYPSMAKTRADIIREKLGL